MNDQAGFKIFFFSYMDGLFYHAQVLLFHLTMELTELQLYHFISDIFIDFYGGTQPAKVEGRFDDHLLERLQANIGQVPYNKIAGPEKVYRSQGVACILLIESVE